jgi:thiol-disulfide isomerase/thioredoxin
MNTERPLPIRAMATLPAVLLLAAAASQVEAKKAKPTLPFGKELDRALEQSSADGRPVVVAFVAAWCPLCNDMKSRVFPDPQLLELSDDFIWVMVDIDRQLTLAREQQIEGVPLIKVLDADGSMRDLMLGLWEAKALADRLQVALTDQASPADAEGRARSDLTWKPRGYRGAGVCFSHVGYGPLSIYAQSAFQSLRLGIRPRTPSTLGRGQFQLRGTATWSNFWAVDLEVDDPDNTYFLDFETLQTAVALAYGITDHFELELELQNRNRFGGALDGLSQGFHDLFGIDQNGRDRVDKGLFTFELDPPDGSGPVALDNSDDNTPDVAFHVGYTQRL